MRFQLEPLPSLSELSTQWRKLEAVALPSLFNSWHWTETLLAVLPERSRPALLRGSIAGETVALALIGQRCDRRRWGLIRSRSLYLNETGDPSQDLGMEYNGVVSAPERKPAALNALFAWFSENRADFDELHIRGSEQRFCSEWFEERRLWHSEIAVPRYHVELSQITARGRNFFSIFSPNFRQQLRRSVRVFEKSGRLELQKASSTAEALAFFQDFKRLHTVSWERRGKAHCFSNPFFERFHRTLIKRTFEEGAIELLKATAGPRLLGYLYNFRWGDRVYAYQSGFDYENNRDRPGVVAHMLAIREAHARGIAVYDFLAGQNRLKEGLSTHCGSMFWHVLSQPRLRFGIEYHAKRIKRYAATLRGLKRKPNLHHTQKEVLRQS